MPHKICRHVSNDKEKGEEKRMRERGRYIEGEKERARLRGVGEKEKEEVDQIYQTHILRYMN